jgi:hypothetical protein
MLSTIEIIPVDTLEHILIEIYYRIISRTFNHRYLQPILINLEEIFMNFGMMSIGIVY